MHLLEPKIRLLPSENNARGDVFTRLLGLLFAGLGYEGLMFDSHKPGREVDIQGHHRLDKHLLVAECKAWNRPVYGEVITKFRGVKGIESDRAESNRVVAYFISLNGFATSVIEQEKTAKASRLILLDGQMVIEEMGRSKAIISSQDAVTKVATVAEYWRLVEHNVDGIELLCGEAGFFWAIYYAHGRQRTHFGLVDERGIVVAESVAKQVIAADASSGGLLGQLSYLAPPPPPPDKAATDELQVILEASSLSRVILSQSYFYARPEFAFPVGDARKDSASAYVQDLAMYSRSRSEFTPLSKFVASLIIKAGNEEIGHGLTKWLKEAIGDKRLVELLETIRTELPVTQSVVGDKPPTLFVQVQRIEREVEHYSVSGWRVVGLADRCLCLGDRMDIERLQAAVRDWLFEIADEGVSLDRVEVQFTLPAENLGLDVDQWPYWESTNYAARFPLGSVCRWVYVRPLEVRGNARHLQKKRWHWIKNNHTASCQWRDDLDGDQLKGPAIFLTSDRCASDFAAVLARRLDVCCVAVHPGPNGCDLSDQFDSLANLIGTGIPIILWIRRDIDGSCRVEHQEATSFFKELFDQSVPISELPRVVSRRRNGHSPSTSNDRRLTVVWDDPSWTPRILNSMAVMQEPRDV